jgi:hypothetical protein
MQDPTFSRRLGIHYHFTFQRYYLYSALWDLIDVSERLAPSKAVFRLQVMPVLFELYLFV